MSPTDSEPESDFGRDPVEVLAESFMARFRRGERPSLSEYVARYPHLEKDILELMPALVELEANKADDSGSPEAPVRPFKHPESLGDYQILRYIGGGGMGDVYEAVRGVLHCHVALKVIRQQYRDDPDYRRKFLNEASLAAGLHHTNIVPVIDYGEHDGTCFYAMQFIPGQGLHHVLAEVRRLRAAEDRARARPHDPRESSTQEHLARTVALSLLTGRFGPPEVDSADATTQRALAPPSSPSGAASVVSASDGHGSGVSSEILSGPRRHYFRQVARIGQQAAEALEYAHRRRVIHRDIKPANLLLDAEGNVWVTDFGLAKVEADDLSRSRELAGTLRYMPPERLRGRFDRRVDIYALGATLYELLTLRPVFEERDQVRLMHLILTETPTRPRAIDPSIPRDLETIILKAMAKESADRYATADEMAHDLRFFREDRPIAARPIGGAERTWRWCRRNPALATLTAAVTLLLLTVSIVTSALSIGLGRANAEKTEQLWMSRRTEARALRLSHQYGQRFEALAALTEAAKIHATLGVRNEAIASLALVDARLKKLSAFGELGTSGRDFDSRLEQYAVGDKQGMILVRRIADDRELFRLPGDAGFIHSLAFSPDRRYLAVVSDDPKRGRCCRLWDLARDPKAATVIQGHPHLWLHGFSPDSRLLALGNLSWDAIGLFATATGSLIKEVGKGARADGSAFSSDGRRLVVRSLASRTVRIIDLERGLELWAQPCPMQSYGLAWSSDGRLIAIGGADSRIYVLDTERKRVQSVLEGHTGLPSGLSFTNGGDLLISEAWDGTTRIWEPIRGKLLWTAPGHILRLGLDDREAGALLNENRFAIWELATARECRVLHHGRVGNQTPRPQTWGPFGLDFGLGGRLLASADHDGVRLWDSASGVELLHLPIGPNRCVRFSPDGETLLTFGLAGLQLWPVRLASDAGKATLRIGPPQTLDRLPPGDGGNYSGCVAEWDASGRRIAAIDMRRQQAVLLDAQTGAEVARTGVHARPRHVALSPDANWIATSTWAGEDVRVWDAAGKPAWKLSTSSARVIMSPDGRWLCTDTGGVPVQLRRIGTWQPGPELPADCNGRTRFTPDGRTLAVGSKVGAVRLLDTETGREIAALTPPPEVSSEAVWMVFSPSGDRLAISNTDHQILVWDLRLIREQLKPMGLDWVRPDFPPPSSVEPIRSAQLVAAP